MRYWVCYSKEASLRFLSHLDLMRAWHRALRRAGVPVRYTEGFNPQPKLSLTSALPVGAISTGEYAEIWLEKKLTDEEEKLIAALPAGIKLLAWREVPQSVPSLASLLTVSRWRLRSNDLTEKELALLAKSLMEKKELFVTRRSGKRVNIRPHILTLDLVGEQAIEVLLESGGSGGANPREVALLLTMHPAKMAMQRTGLYYAKEKKLQSPMELLICDSGVEIDVEKNHYQL